MTTSDTGLSILDRVPVERITAEARQIQFRRIALTVLAALFYVIGWTVAKLFAVIWLAITWSFTAIKLGWEEGRRTDPNNKAPR